MIEKLPGWLVGVGMVIGGGLVGVWWAFTFIPHQGVEGNLAHPDSKTVFIFAFRHQEVSPHFFVR